MSVSCALCGSPDARVLYDLPNGAIHRCMACRVVFRANLVAGAAASDLYEDDGYLDTPYFEALKVGSRQDVEPYLVYRRALSRLESLTSNRRLLDVGSSYGAFLDMARYRGWEVSGVDLSAKATTYAARERNLQVFTGTLEDARFPGNHFSVVSLWDVVEHLDAPLTCLQEIHRILEPGGVLVIFTINQRSLINRVGDVLYRVSLGRATKPLTLLYDIHHNFFFDPGTLGSLLQGAGFRAEVARDHLGANIDRWQNLPIPWFLALGTKVLDALAGLTGQHYRMILYVRKEAPEGMIA